MLGTNRHVSLTIRPQLSVMQCFCISFYNFINKEGIMVSLDVICLPVYDGIIDKKDHE